MASAAPLASLIRWCCDEQARSQYLLELLESEKARTSADLGNGWTDTTARSLAETRRKVDELGGLLRHLDEEYEKRQEPDNPMKTKT